MFELICQQSSTSQSEIVFNKCRFKNFLQKPVYCLLNCLKMNQSIQLWICFDDRTYFHWYI